MDGRTDGLASANNNGWWCRKKTISFIFNIYLTCLTEIRDKVKITVNFYDISVGNAQILALPYCEEKRLPLIMKKPKQCRDSLINIHCGNHRLIHSRQIH